MTFTAQCWGIYLTLTTIVHQEPSRWHSLEKQLWDRTLRRNFCGYNNYRFMIVTPIFKVVIALVYGELHQIWKIAVFSQRLMIKQHPAHCCEKDCTVPMQSAGYQPPFLLINNPCFAGNHSAISLTKFDVSSIELSPYHFINILHSPAARSIHHLIPTVLVKYERKGVHNNAVRSTV